MRQYMRIRRAELKMEKQTVKGLCAMDLGKTFGVKKLKRSR